MRSIILLLCSLMLLGASIDTKIKKKQRELRTTQRQISGLNLKLSKLAKNIAALQMDLAKVDRRIKELDLAVSQLSKEHDLKLKELKKIEESIQKLTQKHSKLKEQLILAISKAFSTSLLLASLGEESERDVLKEEVLKAIQKKEEQRLQNISKEFAKTKNELQNQQKHLSKLKAQIEELLRKKSELKALKIAKAKKLKKLDSQKRRYNEELQNLIQQKRALQKTLERLNIIKEQQRSKNAKVKVKKYGGYKKDRTVRYRGPKTIAPLKRFIIVKRYGVYKDPIYKIEIPNENIELKPLEPNAKVRNVLNGRIILAKWTPHLKNVVIVKHDDGLYTIYANMDRLAPYVKKGRRIKKGYILGRVNTKLIFEVTKNSAHINPLDLIRVR